MHISNERPQDELSASAAASLTFRNLEALQRSIERASAPVVVWDGRRSGPFGGYLTATPERDVRQGQPEPVNPKALPAPTPNMDQHGANRRVEAVFERLAPGETLTVYGVARVAGLTDYFARRAVAALVDAGVVEQAGFIPSVGRGVPSRAYRRAGDQGSAR